VNRNRSRGQRIRRAREAMLPKAIEALKNPALVDQAVRWYSDKCGDITYRMMKVSGMNEWQCCVILAALSANKRWQDNVRHAIQAAEYIGGRDVPFPGGTKYHVDNIVWAGAHPKDPARELTGRKTRNFAKAIYGDEAAVTVDLWICKAANLTKRDGNPVKRPTDPQYDIVEAAIDQISQEIGLSPRDTQALIWIAVRGSAD